MTTLRASLKVLRAHRVLILYPRLSDGARRIGSAILEHYSDDTNQCDPSTDRLVELLDMARATVFRGINLLEEERLFRRTTHGGEAHRNAYIPNWTRFDEIEDEWHRRFHSGSEERSARLVDVVLASNLEARGQ